MTPTNGSKNATFGNGYQPIIPPPPSENKLPNGHRLNAENYMKDFADSLPTITVDKFSGSENSYTSNSKFPDYDPEDKYDFLTVDTRLVC